MPEPTPSWATAPEFAEVAEACGVRTASIMAWRHDGPADPHVVLYTPELPDDYDIRRDGAPEVYSMILQRDGDGILRRVGEPKLMPGMWNEILHGIDAQLGDES